MGKILISPDYGAGWSTWNHGPVSEFMLRYEPIIQFIENSNQSSLGQDHPLVTQLVNEAQEKFGEQYVCVLGASCLIVVETSGPFTIREYDGAEYIEYKDDIKWND